MKSYCKDYPRPQLVRKNWANLNGNWGFAFDDQNKGEEECWFSKSVVDQTINVPFTYETKLSGIGEEEVHKNVWYEKSFQADCNDLTKQKLLLHFEGSDYETKVWVNGNFVGAHTGGYSRFSFDISRYVVDGENKITVKVEDSLDEQQPRGKQRFIGENFGCWYVQTTGIWKTVWMEYVPVSFVENVKMTPDLSNHSLDLDFHVQSEVYGRNLEIRAAVYFKDTFVNQVRIPVSKEHVSTTIDVYSKDVQEWGVMTWAPGHPDLYDIEFELYEDGESVDFVLSYFGMREIRINQGNVLLNGEPLYQRLILDQGYWEDSHLTPPSEEALIEDIDKIFELGYNGLRKHQKIEDERFLYWCDVKGMLVWSEAPAAYEFSDYAVEIFTTQWMEMVKQNYNHPAIIVWTPFNESWGIKNVETNREEQHFTEAIYHLTKVFDKNRPVIVNDGWEHTISDIITLHDYEEVGECLFHRYNDFKDEILSDGVYHNGGKSAFAQGYSYKGQPIIISEFGGIAFNNDDSGWGYGNKVENKEAFLKRFDDITTAIKKLPYVCGYCYTQVSDVQQEINGLMDIKRNFKIDAHLIKEVNMKNAGIYKQV